MKRKYPKDSLLGASEDLNVEVRNLGRTLATELKLDVICGWLARLLNKRGGNGMSNGIKIRITRASRKTYWYANKIGEVFSATVNEWFHERGYHVDNCVGDGHGGYISVEDCEVVTIDGRKAVVIDADEQYATYIDFARKYGYPDSAGSGVSIRNGAEVTLLVSGPHMGGHNGCTLWIVETEKGTRHIIGESGLRIAVSSANVTVLTDELGLQREYNEVKRKANVGERIKTLTSGSSNQYSTNAIYEVREPMSFPSGVIRIDSFNGGTVHIYDDNYVVLEPSDIVRMDFGTHGGRYRLVERKADVGERIVALGTDSFGDDGISAGDVFEVKKIDGVHMGMHGACFTDKKDRDYRAFWETSKYRVLVPLASETPTAPQPKLSVQVAELTARVTELEAEVNALNKRSKPMMLSDISVAEIRPKQPLTRDGVVARAKAELNVLKGSPPTKRSGWAYGFKGLRCDAEFIVNNEKRTVIVLLRHRLDNSVQSRGIAKCAPGDVFNAHIGKAIALRRALGLEVPTEYTKAPQPTEARVGDVVEYRDTRTSLDGQKRTISAYKTEMRMGAYTFTNGFFAYEGAFVIIEDTVSTGGDA